VEAEEAEEVEEDEEEVEEVEEVGYLCTLDAEAGRLLDVEPLALPPLARRAGTADLGRCAVLVAPPSGPLV
jgi:hypothetical protein